MIRLVGAGVRVLHRPQSTLVLSTNGVGSGIAFRDAKPLDLAARERFASSLDLRSMHAHTGSVRVAK